MHKPGRLAYLPERLVDQAVLSAFYNSRFYTSGLPLCGSPNYVWSLLSRFSVTHAWREGVRTVTAWMVFIHTRLFEWGTNNVDVVAKLGMVHRVYRCPKPSRHQLTLRD